MNDRIRLLRNELGLSIRKFAEDLNLTAGTISLIENNKRNVTDRTISDICRLYHVSEEWLRTGKGEMFQERTREVEIAEITAQMFKAADDDIRYQLIKIVSQMSETQLEAFKNVAEMLVKAINKED